MRAVGTFLLSSSIALLTLNISGLASAQVPPPGEGESQYPLAVRTEIVVPDLGTSLDNWCGVTFEFMPDGRIMCGELRSGKVRIIENNTLSEPLIELDIYAGYKNPPSCTIFDEQGLVGLALDPDFENNQYVYLHWTYQAGETVDCGDTPTARQVARFTLVDGKLEDKKILIDGIPGAKQHVGGPLEFGPDGKLYVTGGEAGQRNMAQDLDSPLGKTLRINPDGTIPEDNPFSAKPYYTVGHRNVFGIAFHPQTGVPYITENGPETNDEVNILYSGENYGWPDVLGTSTDPAYVSPIFDSGPGTIAPTEAEFYVGDRYPPELVNDLFFLAYNSRSLERLELQPPEYDSVVAHHTYQLPPTGQGSYTDIELGPDGYLYVSDFRSISRVIFEYTSLPTSIRVEEPEPTSVGEPTTVTATIVDAFENPVVNVPLNFIASGTPIGSASTNQDGVARLSYTPTSGGNFSISVRFDGTERFVASTSTQEIILVVEGSSTPEPQILEAMADNNILVRLSILPSASQADNSSLSFAVKFIDPRNDNELESIPYIAEITKDNRILYSQRAVTSGILTFHQYDFEDFGSAEIAIKEINNTPSSVRFSINIIPEFPVNAAVVPLFGFLMVLLVLRFGKLRFQIRRV